MDDPAIVDDKPVVEELIGDTPPPPPAPAHCMVDLETWGVSNKGLPVSIGACLFNETDIIDRFHVAIDPVSAEQFSLKMDAATILWWFDPDRDAARRRWLKMERVDLPSALVGFSDWLATSGMEIKAIWGNGSTFDNVIFRSAYEAAGLEYPVKFWQDQCYRTMKNQMPGVKLVREGTHHDALDDAISQAKHLQSIWRQARQDHLRDMLERCASQFHFYEAQHRAKGTPEADEKAAVNGGFVTDIRRLLDGGPYES